MERYDSSPQTLEHIRLVGINIDRICEVVSSYGSFAVDLEDATLVDLCFRGIKYDIKDNCISNFIRNTNIQSIDSLILQLQERKVLHDKTKLEEPEKSQFDIWTPKLKTSTYGSDEYKRFLFELRDVLAHHYANNRHHPEHFAEGICGMNLIDVIEMICDWDASTKRQDDGNVYQSISMNKDRFVYSYDVAKVFVNTIRYFK